jgi:adenosylcobinamide amidohydrolase
MILAGLWAYLYSIKSLVISGKEITSLHKNLVILSAVVLVTVVFAWEIVFYTIIFVAAGIMVHAAFHNPPEKYGTYAPPQIPV